jgi:hypothetical protein
MLITFEHSAALLFNSNSSADAKNILQVVYYQMKKKELGASCNERVLCIATSIELLWVDLLPQHLPHDLIVSANEDRLMIINYQDKLDA